MKLWNDGRLSLDLTALGLEFLAIILLLGVFAVNTGNNMLYALFSLMLGMFLVSGLASVRALRGISPAGIEVGNLFARMRGDIRLSLEDQHPGRARALELRLTAEHGVVEPAFHGGNRAAERMVKIALSLVPEHRGACALTELELRTRFPFGFIEKSLRLPLDHVLLIIPHPRSKRIANGALGNQKASRPVEGTLTPDGTRKFRPGDSIRKMHWKRTAQRNEPWVRTFEDENPEGIHLELDLRKWEPGAAFEKELESLSGVILQARIHRRRVSLDILEAHGRISFQDPTPCWRALALASPLGGVHNLDGGGERGAL